MTQQPIAHTPTPAADRRARIMASLWFGPLVAVWLLHQWLKMRAETLPDIEPIQATHYTQAIAPHGDAAIRALMWQASWPLLASVAALAVAVLIAWYTVRRLGGRRAGVIATALWCVACLGAALAMIANHVNHADLKPLPPVTATVIAAQPYPTSERGPGGALTWLQPPPGTDGASSANNTPWLVKIEGADFQAMPAGARVTLQRARGALWGVYLTGSDAPQARPLSDHAPTAPAPSQKASQMTGQAQPAS